MGISDVYSLSTGRLLENLVSVDNPFIRQVASLSIQSAKSAKMVSFITKDVLSNRGQVKQKGVLASDKSVIDICKLTPLVGEIQGVKTLLDEMAYARAEMLNFNKLSPTFWKDNAYILATDYLLSSSLCYVEVFNGNNRVDKYFATRNRGLAGALTGQTDEETLKYEKVLETYNTNYTSKSLKMLKIGIVKNGFKITQPKSPVDFSGNVKVTPLFLMSTFVEGVTDILSSNILRFKYIKDNLTEREFITTMSTTVLNQHYDNDFVQRMMSNVSMKMDRGYIRLPELGISKYDASGVRALNLSRITSVEVIESFDASYINVDFDSILPVFKETVQQQRDIRVLNMIYEDLTASRSTASSYNELQHIIVNYVDTQFMLGTTTALRHLHKYMISRPQFFRIYNNGERKEYGRIRDGFNLGVSDN